MKKAIIILGLILLGGIGLRAQDTTGVARVDSTFVGKDILSIIGPGVEISQSPAMKNALRSYIKKNAEKTITGYRVRVFYDNSASARSRSAAIEAELRRLFPEHGVYRNFISPNYKVAIGDFRTKDEALKVYNSLKASYPTAYIIKESINYPR